MKKSLLALCACALLAQATPSFAWEIPSLNTVLRTVSFGYFGSEEEKDEQKQVINSEEEDENIVLGSGEDEDTEAEPIAFDFDALTEIDPRIRLLEVGNPYLKMSEANLISTMNDLFKADSADSQAGINFFISLHRADASQAANIFVSKKFSDEFRLALLKDTPSVYAASLLHDLRHNLRGQEIYHRGDFVFKHPQYGTKEANCALISGELVPAQYLPFLLISGLSETDPEVEYKYLERVSRLENILASMEREQLLALFLFQPDEAVIKIGPKNQNYCLGVIKSDELCEIPMEGGVNEEFLVRAFEVIAGKHIDVVAEIIEHEYKNFPERGKFIIKETQIQTLRSALKHIKDTETRDAITRMRPKASIQDLLGSLSSNNLLDSRKADDVKKDNVVYLYVDEGSYVEDDLEAINKHQSEVL